MAKSFILTGPLTWLDAKTDKVKLFGVMSFAFRESPRYTVSAKLNNPLIMEWVKKTTNNCNIGTCNQGCVDRPSDCKNLYGQNYEFFSLPRMCMTGKELDKNTKRTFYGPQPVLVKPLNKRFGFLDFLNRRDSSESSESSESSKSSGSLEKPGIRRQC